MSAELRAIEPEDASADLIAMLEEALGRARSGELSSAAVAMVYRDGRMGHLWSTAPSVGLLLGSAARLAH